jgi:hypothetical protein
VSSVQQLRVDLGQARARCQQERRYALAAFLDRDYAGYCSDQLLPVAEELGEMCTTYVQEVEPLIDLGES